MSNRVITFESALQLLNDAHHRELGALQSDLEKLKSRVAAYERSAATEAVASGADPDAHSNSDKSKEVKNVQFANDVAEKDPAERTADDRAVATPSSSTSMEGSGQVDWLKYIRKNFERSETRVHGEGASNKMRLRSYSSKIVDAKFFDITMGIVILVNSVLIGIEIDLSITGENENLLNWLFGIDFLFLFIYVLELLLRFLAGGRRIIFDNWIKFDVVLVTIGLISGLLTIIGLMASGGGVSGIRDYLEKIIILRILRLCRMVRAVKMIGKWQTLWKLIQGASRGMRTLGSVLVMLFFSIYVFACIGAEFLTRDDKLLHDSNTKAIISEKFSSLPIIFATLLQFVLVDGLADIYMPLVMVNPALTVVYFGLLICFLSILMANLVTAVLVDDAIQNSQNDERMRRNERKQMFETMEPKLRKAFKYIDEDGSGELGKAEFMKADLSKRHDLAEVAELLKPETIIELYDLLDTDESGTITEDELITGLMKLKLAETSLEIAQIKQIASQSQRSLKSVKVTLDKLVDAIRNPSNNAMENNVRLPTVISSGSFRTGNE